ncbi:hypothetical protein [Cysteiniphilum sp. 6C5]|uniref:hypothetical protein n=1 Tax=unclassified Cysteiniphilum TaxID=2610889 RepID=UPI003F83778F
MEMSDYSIYASLITRAQNYTKDQVNNASNTSNQKDFVNIYAAYNSMLASQYTRVLETIIKSLYLELTALNLHYNHGATISSAFNYQNTPNNFQARAKFIETRFNEVINDFTSRTNRALIDNDFHFNRQNKILKFAGLTHQHSWGKPTYNPVVYADYNFNVVYDAHTRKVGILSNVGDEKNTFTVKRCSSVGGLTPGFTCKYENFQCDSRIESEYDYNQLPFGVNLVKAYNEYQSGLLQVTVTTNNCPEVVLSSDQLQRIKERVEAIQAN